MKELKYTLICDGSSDKIFMPIIKWTFDVNFPKLPVKGYWADLRMCLDRNKSISSKIDRAQTLYPFNILFYHRDAETNDLNGLSKRKNEIFSGIEDDDLRGRTVCLIPIRMMESWLLFDKDAIKKASGNRNYSGPIDLPQLNRIEQEKHPKELLHKLLTNMSGLRGRNLDKFNPYSAVHRVAENINDFTPLRKLIAFQKFEEDLITVVTRYIK